MEFELRKGNMKAVVIDKGGELVSLRDRDGTEYIWGGDPAYWPGRNPTLFPIVGGLKDGTVRCKGAPYHMGRHGFARDSVFDMEDRGADFAVFGLRERPETLAQYPFRFCLKIRHQLLEDGFSTTFEVENPDSVPLPFCIGAHTAFRCPLGKGERFEDYQIVLDQPEDTPSRLLDERGCIRHDGWEDVLHGTGTIDLDHALFDRLDTVILDRPRSESVSLRHRASGRGVRLNFHEFPMVAFWTKAGAAAPFVCLEPWHGCAALDNESGAMEEKPHCISLAPGERKTLTYTVTVLPGKS